MCPLQSEIYTPPYYRDLMAAPMGSPFMFNDLGTGMGMYPMGGMYGAYGGYFPPYLYGVRLKPQPSRDIYTPTKEQVENKRNLNKFLKYAGIALGSLFAICFLKGKMIDGAINAGQHTFWTKLFKLNVKGLPKP